MKITNIQRTVLTVQLELPLVVVVLEKNTLKGIQQGTTLVLLVN